MIIHNERYYREKNRKLVEEALKAGLSIIEDRINRRGGGCRLDGKIIIVYDRNTSWHERNRLIIEALQLAGGEGMSEGLKTLNAEVDN
jgi:hypothetical protein